jgi:hypothetical protein
MAFPNHLFAIYDSDATSELDLNESAAVITDEPPTKRKKTSFEILKSEKLSYQAICKTLQDMQQNVYYCCSMLCYTWLTVNIILFCRQQYLLLENTKDRQDWIASKLQERNQRIRNRANIYIALSMKRRKSNVVAKLEIYATV